VGKNSLAHTFSHF